VANAISETFAPATTDGGELCTLALKSAALFPANTVAGELARSSPNKLSTWKTVDLVFVFTFPPRRWRFSGAPLSERTLTPKQFFRQVKKTDSPFACGI